MGTQACQTQAQGGTPPPHSAKYHHRRFIYKQLENGQKTNVSFLYIYSRLASKITQKIDGSLCFYRRVSSDSQTDYYIMFTIEDFISTLRP